MIRHLIAFGLSALLLGCGPWPEPALDDAAARAAPYPRLLPLESLLAGAPATAAPAGPPASRIAALNARAARLRGPVIDADTRARMQAGIDTQPFR